MDKLRCIIADDEPLALELMESLLRPHTDLEIAAVCRNGREALAAIRNEQPDLAFLDIEMSGLNGFDVIRRLQPETMPAIVFTTAFNQYAIDAFEIHAVDYVLKPLNAERLGMAIERARQRLTGEQRLKVEKKASIMGAIDKMAGASDTAETLLPEDRAQDQGEAKKLLIRDSGKTHVVDPAAIDWVDAAGDYMCIHVGSETLVARMTMKKLEELLDERMFARIHRSTLVNVSNIQKIEHVGKGDSILHLPNDVTLKASRSYREHLMELLG